MGICLHPVDDWVAETRRQSTKPPVNSFPLFLFHENFFLHNVFFIEHTELNTVFWKIKYYIAHVQFVHTKKRIRIKYVAVEEYSGVFVIK